MKKKIAILSLIAIFISTSFLTAQTATVKKDKAPAKTEVKCEKKADPKDAKCCQGKTAAECAKMTPAEKAKCKTECKEKKADMKCCKEGEKCKKDEKCWRLSSRLGAGLKPEWQVCF